MQGPRGIDGIMIDERKRMSHKKENKRGKIKGGNEYGTVQTTLRKEKEGTGGKHIAGRAGGAFIVSGEGRAAVQKKEDAD